MAVDRLSSLREMVRRKLAVVHQERRRAAMSDDQRARLDRVRELQTSFLESRLAKVLIGVDDPVERILLRFAFRYAGNSRMGDFEAAVDALEEALDDIRALRQEATDHE